MAEGFTYGVDFPFDFSPKGDSLKMTEYVAEEIRASLLHLLLTRKGSRYYLPDFGTRLYEFLFDPLDIVSFDVIEDDIRGAVTKYIPNLVLNKITIEPIIESEEMQTNKLNVDEMSSTSINRIYRTPGKGTYENTAKIKIEYTTTNNTFAGSDFVIINI
ncbi:MAG: GPW/gp25 family protein [Chitinophagaceae bacterium]|nr:GPW/gp25 family protein [Chitinophagaceae bacterium]